VKTATWQQTELTSIKHIAVIGANVFGNSSHDNLAINLARMPEAKTLLLIDGNAKCLHHENSLHNELIRLDHLSVSLLCAVLLPKKLCSLRENEDLYFYSRDSLSGGNYFGLKIDCDRRCDRSINIDNIAATSQKVDLPVLSVGFLNEYNPDFLQIDIEGPDIEIVYELITQTPCRPKCIVAEYQYQLMANIKNFNNVMKRNGYKLLPHPESPEMNLVYLKQE